MKGYHTTILPYYHTTILPHYHTELFEAVGILRKLDGSEGNWGCCHGACQDRGRERERERERERAHAYYPHWSWGSLAGKPLGPTG